MSAAFNRAGRPVVRIIQYCSRQRWPSGRRRKPSASPKIPQIGFARGDVSAVHPFTCVTALMVACLLCRSDLSHRGVYIRAFSRRVTPPTAGYHYGAILDPAPTGLSPASQTASFAACRPDRRLEAARLPHRLHLRLLPRVHVHALELEGGAHRGIGPPLGYADRALARSEGRRSCTLQSPPLTAPVTT